MKVLCDTYCAIPYEDIRNFYNGCLNEEKRARTENHHQSFS